RLGETRWVYDRGRIRKDDRGVLMREGMLVDVTPRRIYEQRQRERDELRRREQQELVRIATSPAVIEGRINEAAQLITQAAANLLLVERASLWLLSEDNRSLVCVNLYERTPRRHSHGTSITASDYPRYCEALQAGRGIDASDAAPDPRTSERASNSPPRHAITSRPAPT